MSDMDETGMGIKIITGGVTAARGFKAASTAAGIKYKNRQDMAMIYSQEPCRAAGTFTTNIAVSYTHLDVYKRQLLGTLVNVP